MYSFDCHVMYVIHIMVYSYGQKHFSAILQRLALSSPAELWCFDHFRSTYLQNEIARNTYNSVPM